MIRRFSCFLSLFLLVSLNAQAESAVTNAGPARAETVAATSAAVSLPTAGVVMPTPAPVEENEKQIDKCLSFEPLQMQYRAPAAATESCPCRGDMDPERALFWKVNVKNSCGKIVSITASLTTLGPDGFLASDSFAEAYEQISVNTGNDTLVGKFIKNSQSDINFGKTFSRVRVTFKSQSNVGGEQVLRIFDIPTKDISINIKAATAPSTADFK